MRNPKLLAILTLVLAAGLLAACNPFSSPCPDPCAPCPSCDDILPLEGITNLSDLTLTGDLVVGDDATITDDLDLTGKVTIDGAANEVQITVQEYATPTNAALVIEDFEGTDVAAFRVAPASAGNFDLLDLTDTTPILNGSDNVVGLDINLTGANHTGASNFIYGIDLDLTTADADATETAIDISDTDWDIGIKSALEQEHLLLPTIASAAVTYQSSGAIWTVADGELWYIHAVFCHITTNFDCTGDDCTMDVGDDEDTNGLLDLDDAELQTADTEGTGAPAGWQGIMSSDTVGAYLTQGIGFLYDPSGAAQSIDVAIGGTDPAAGAATCYIVYTRIE